MAGVTPPTTFAAVNGAWTDGVSQVVNGLCTLHTASQTADVTLTTSGQDATGLSVTVTCATANSICLIWGSITWAVSVAAAGNLVGTLFRDGAGASVRQMLDSSAQTFGFRSGSAFWTDQPGAGSHTYKIQVNKDAAGATAKAVAATNGGLIVLVIDSP